MWSSPLFNVLIALGYWGIMINQTLAHQNLLNINCSNDTFIPSSTYHTNLSKLRNSLTSNARNFGLFSNLVTGLNVEPNSTVYSQISCRGDYNISKCSSCVASATRTLSSRCPTSVSAHVWYQDCKVYYSNVKFFGVYNESLVPVWYLRSDNSRISAHDAAFIEGFVSTTFPELVNQVASANTDLDKIQSSFLGDRGVKYFGTKVTNFTSSSPNKQLYVMKLYQMVQCTPDLSVKDCNRCLTSMMNHRFTCCKGSLGGRVETRSCFIRYETYPFYNTSTTTRDHTTTSDVTSNLLGKISLKMVIAIVAPVSILLGLATLGIGLCAWKVKHKNYSPFSMSSDDSFDPVESLQYSLDELKAATQNFSDDNNIGKGGFGCVYKGILRDGQEIAVKKLYKSTSQVEEEFKNEVRVLAKIQHINLVRLLGFCMAEGENLLVFEYVPNPSLNRLLFDTEADQMKLNWMTRFKIITGIARGLLYLHEESQYSIVHRDLKPANILLDSHMNPKIADFGMARFYGIKQKHGDTSIATGSTMKNFSNDITHQSTRRGGGTPGYMAPECSPRGQFSKKTDVYSYGVMILEIISGKRNSSFCIPGLAEDLLSYSWIQWKAGNPMALIDEALESEIKFSSEEIRDQVLMCIHIGLLCIQNDSKVRPTMRMIVHVYANFQLEFKRWARSIFGGQAITPLY